MYHPIIIIDCSKVRQGKLEDVKAGMNELVEFAKANEPRMIAYNVYLSEDNTHVTVFQVHPDSASAEFHMEVARALFRKFVEFIDLAGIDVYGTPSQNLLDRLQQKAEMLGSGTVRVHELLAGFGQLGTPNRDVFDS